jgi:cytoskeletal protein RodZ
VRDAVTDIESETAPARNVSVAVAEVAVDVSAVVCAAVAEETTKESAFTTALEGAIERTPRPKAATATSATRLKVVFVDMCFLSIVDPRNFRRSAWASNALS